ncbi:MAG: DUF4440 domain-containing protein [Gemmatimonadota bacterium]|nr:DUF4440 domain-containing protein [Gemmatimonadota bacterium]
MARRLTAVLPLALSLLVATACRPAPAAGGATGDAAAAPLSAADLAAVRAADSSFATAVGAGDAAGVAAVYTADARLMPPNAATIEGREGIQKFWGGFLAAYQLRIDLSADEVEGRGDLAYMRGHFRLDGTSKAKDGAPIHDQGKYLEILRRQPDGTWRYAVDMYSSDLPAPAAK